MASHSRSVNLLQPEADSVVLDWLRCDDEDSNDEEQEQHDGPQDEIVPNELFSDSEDGCIPSNHDSDSECSPDTSSDEETQDSVRMQDIITEKIGTNGQETHHQVFFLYKRVPIFI